MNTSKKILLSDQQLNDLTKSGHVVINGKYAPGKIYKLENNDRITMKCTQWFSSGCDKSHFLKINA
jgi:hypothetical protein